MTRSMMYLFLVLALGFGAIGHAADGDTNFTNVVASGDVTVGDDLTVTDDVVISGTLSGPTLIDITAPYAFTADVTLNGNGVDLLFDTANQNSIGGATKGAKAVFARALTGETGTALTISASSGITISSAPTISADTTLSGNGVDLLFNAANQNSIGAAAAGAKEVFARALTGETGTALTISAGSGITVGSATTINAALTVTGSSSHSGRLTVGTIFPGGGCPDLASAATMAPTESCHVVTGSTSITTLTTGNFVDGDRLLLIYDGSITMTEGNDIVSAGNFAAGQYDTQEFVYANTFFIEVGRSDN